VPKLELHDLHSLNFSARGKIRFKATDDLRGDVEVTITDPDDVHALVEFLAEALTAWQSPDGPGERFQLIESDAA
jgi:hypothetical protein